MNLVSTPGSASANTYADLAYSNAYFSSRLGSTTWLEGDAEFTTVALAQSTRVLDSLYDWNGWRATETQALKWPRDGAPDYDQAFGSSSTYDFDTSLTVYYDNDIVPKSVMDATCEFALTILTNSGYAASVNDLKIVKVGPIRVDFKESAVSYTIPNVVIEMLRGMGTYAGSMGGNVVSTPSLVRT